VKATYVDENAAERERLKVLAASLTDEDLDTELKNGSTVAGALVHLAYWDEYCIALLREWEASGFTPVRGNLEASNAALRAIGSAVPGGSALRLALAAAEATDEHVERLAADLVSAIESGGGARILNRARHRRAHLDQIEQAIGWSRPGAS
jgi:hypothetical protein